LQRQALLLQRLKETEASEWASVAAAALLKKYNVPLEEHPLLREMAALSFQRALGGEVAGIPPESELADEEELEPEAELAMDGEGERGDGNGTTGPRDHGTTDHRPGIRSGQWSVVSGQRQGEREEEKRREGEAAETEEPEAEPAPALEPELEEEWLPTSEAGVEESMAAEVSPEPTLTGETTRPEAETRVLLQKPRRRRWLYSSRSRSRSSR
jgi:hypothetical protein